MQGIPERSEKEDRGIMKYTKTQAVIDMLKEWPEGETRNIRTMRQKAEELYPRSG